VIRNGSAGTPTGRIFLPLLGWGELDRQNGKKIPASAHHNSRLRIADFGFRSLQQFLFHPVRGEILVGRGSNRRVMIAA
jgi:hypothetical protein